MSSCNTGGIWREWLRVVDRIGALSLILGVGSEWVARDLRVSRDRVNLERKFLLLHHRIYIGLNQSDVFVALECVVAFL